MKLENIQIENFRQYYGVQRLKFSTDPVKNITVINGNNGAGKTSFFVALNWCLYGEGADNIGELISKEAKRQASSGDKVTARVKLAFRHGSEKYIASRELTGIKQKDGSLDVDAKNKFSLMRIRADGQAIEVKNPIGTLNTILPSNVRTFFLFDGEKIDNFAKPDATDEVRYAVYNVLKLEILKRAINHLSHIADERRRESKQSSSGELLDLLEQDEKIRNNKKEAAKKLEEQREERDSAKRKIVEIDKRLRQLQASRDLQEKRDQIQSDMVGREEELEDVVKEIRDLGAPSASLLAQNAIADALKILDKKRERGEIPSSIRQQFVQDLLERGVCICGSPIKDGDKAHAHLMKLLERSVSGELEDKVLNTNIALNTLVAQNKKLPARLNSLMKRKTTLSDTITGLHAQLDDVTRQLQGSPLEEIGKLEKQRQSFNMDYENDLMDIGKYEKEIADCDEKIAELAKEIEHEKKQKGKNEHLVREMSLAQQSADAIEKIYEEFAEEMRTKIEGKTREIFKKLVWKESHFQDVSLSPEYLLEVIDRFGSPARPELSAGERQVLSLSFITAMVQVSEEEAPIVMDTPFGRLSSDHRANITANLPKLSPQLVLFVTDEELHNQARNNLEWHIGMEYTLDFNGKTSCTQIVEGKP